MYSAGRLEAPRAPRRALDVLRRVRTLTILRTENLTDGIYLWRFRDLNEMSREPRFVQCCSA